MKPKILYQGKYMRLMDRNGWEYVERVRGTGVVMIVALTKENKILLIDQYRPAVNEAVYEFPMGIVGDIDGLEEEPFELAAKRELEEETGYRASQIKLIAKCPMNPGANSSHLHTYFAWDLEKVSEGGGDHTEDIRVHEVPYDQVDAWVGSLTKEEKHIDPRVFAALYWAKGQLT